MRLKWGTVNGLGVMHDWNSRKKNPLLQEWLCHPPFYCSIKCFIHRTLTISNFVSVIGNIEELEAEALKQRLSDPNRLNQESISTYLKVKKRNRISDGKDDNCP